jgi:cell division GTPase FtsZ
MNKSQREEFLSRPADGNVMRVAQQLIKGPAQQRHHIIHALRMLYKVDGVKDLSLKEVIDAINMISERGITE